MFKTVKLVIFGTADVALFALLGVLLELAAFLGLLFDPHLLSRRVFKSEAKATVSPHEGLCDSALVRSFNNKHTDMLFSKEL